MALRPLPASVQGPVAVAEALAAVRVVSDTYRADQFIVDIVLDGTGSVSRLGPFRSEREARKLSDRINRAIERADKIEHTGYFAELYEVVDPAAWRSVVDLSVTPDE